MADKQELHSDEVHSGMRIPVVQEELHVGKRVVESGQGVRLHKSVTEEVLRIEEPLARQELEIEHVPVNAWVEGALPVQRQEGDTLIVPVLEEVLVVEKRVRLKEEIRITARRTVDHYSERVVLRSEQVMVERFEQGGEAGRGPPVSS